MTDKIALGIKEYYAGKIKQFGNSFLGVDWNSKESQYLRFEQLTKIIQPDAHFSILDFGCGYGELINFLSSKPEFTDFKYFGYDFSEEMIREALSQFGESERVSFGTELHNEKFDYSIASGIFNVRLDLCTNDEWFEYILQTLTKMHNSTLKGFSFNALTRYSDKDHMKDYLYYSDPLVLFEYCRCNFSKHISLLHDYELFEFTILVRK